MASASTRSRAKSGAKAKPAQDTEGDLSCLQPLKDAIAAALDAKPAQHLDSEAAQTERLMRLWRDDPETAAAHLRLLDALENTRAGEVLTLPPGLLPLLP